MIYLRRSSYLICSLIFIGLIYSCGHKLPEISPTLITEKTPFDTDDPAIWFNKSNPKESIVFGTDKDEINGGVYAFNLDGNIIKDKSLTGLIYPNNVDIAYDFKLNDSTKTDIMVFTEREKNQIRLYAIPEMVPLDKGGFPVFADETNKQKRRPMGIALYTNPENGEISFIVGRKIGPLTNYLHQYAIVSDSLGIHHKIMRKFGNFSGKKEIEAIAVDNDLGYIYYSDEGACIRKYYANPIKGNDEIACFGGDQFKDDIEGIAIAKYKNGSGYLIVSNQQAGTFNVFDINTNTFIKEINLGTTETDGCDVITKTLSEKFPNGLFVSMNDDRTFFYHDLDQLNLKE